MNSELSVMQLHLQLKKLDVSQRNQPTKLVMVGEFGGPHGGIVLYVGF